MKSTDIQTRSGTLYFLPTKARMPLKFGHQVVTLVTCARVRLTVTNRSGQTAEGWGETPLAVEWGWPSRLAFEPRHQSMRKFCERLTQAYATFERWGHPMDIGHAFLETELPKLLDEHNRETNLEEPMPRLAAMICASAFDLALHDAYGNLYQRPTYSIYQSEFMNEDLSSFLTPGEGNGVSFANRYPADYFSQSRPNRLAAWHLVGGLDPLLPSEIQPPIPQDEHPVALTDWIARDGLTCLKIKLRGNDSDWDYQRLVRVGHIGLERNVEWLTADFNCTVMEPSYVNEILDRLLRDVPRLYQRLLYVEQPFPYDLEAHPIDVRSVNARKPLFMDESAHDWKLVELGRSLGWGGVALKTCKTQTGAILSLCWAKAHGMPLMVQDLSNPMMAQVSHVLLAAYAGTIMGVETNGSQFYPEASIPESKVHPGLYRRREGQVDLSTIGNVGFGHRQSEVARILPEAATEFAR